MVGTRAPLASEAVGLHLNSTNPGFCRPVNRQAHPAIAGLACGSPKAPRWALASRRRWAINPIPGISPHPGPREPMLTHAQLWTALDRLAAPARLSASRLAQA